MHTVYTKIVGDLFHHGHVEFLRQARQSGDRLVVHVVDDDRVSRFKRQPVMTQAERIAVVAGCRWVDEVRADGPRVITTAFLDGEGFDRYAFSYIDEHERRVKLADCPDLSRERILMLAYTQGISTTLILERIKGR